MRWLADFVYEFERRVGDLDGGYPSQARVMCLGAYASIAPAAFDIVEQDSMRRLPRATQRIGQRIKIATGEPSAEAICTGPTVVRDGHGRALDSAANAPSSNASVRSCMKRRTDGPAASSISVRASEASAILPVTRMFMSVARTSRTAASPKRSAG